MGTQALRLLLRDDVLTCLAELVLNQPQTDEVINRIRRQLFPIGLAQLYPQGGIVIQRGLVGKPHHFRRIGYIAHTHRGELLRLREG